MLLDGYMACADDEKTLVQIEKLDSMKLEPQEKLDFLQKRLSYFALCADAQRACESRDLLAAFLQETTSTATSAR